MKYIYLCLLLIFSTVAYSDEISELLDKLPPIIKKNNVGIEYWLTVPPGLSDNAGLENSVKIFVSSFTSTTVTVEIPAKNYKVQKKITLGEVSEFDINPEIAQPYLKSSTEPAVSSEIFKRSGIRVTAESPIICYVLVRNGNSSDGYLAYPVSSLANEYIVSSFNDASLYYPQFNSIPSLTGIVAAYDNTEVTFTLGGIANSQTSSGLKSGEVATKYLSKGDVWMISSRLSGSDLTGSKIKSNYPISVISGNQCANIPITNKYCDYIVEMETPTSTWSDTYFVPTIFGRKFNPLVRIFAKENNTNVYVNGVLIGNIKNAGGILNDGFLEYRSTSQISSDVITADKPISVTLYNTGVEEEGFPEPPGDPFQMILSPLSQFQKIIQLAIPANPAGQKYTYNYLALIFEKTGDSIPEEIEFGTQTKSGIIYESLKNLNPIFKSEFIHPTNQKIYSHFVYKMPNYGVFLLNSTLPFVGYLYGFSKDDSYGMPAGLDLASLEKEDLTPPDVTYTIECDGSITGVTKDLPDNSKVRSNLAGYVFYSEFSENYSKSYIDPLITNETISMNWKLKTIDKQKDAKALMQFWDGAGNFSNVAIIYKAPKISINKNYEFYGNLQTDVKEIRSFIIKNNGSKPFKITKLKLQNEKSGYNFEQEIPQEIELLPNQEFSFDVSFVNQKSGLFIDSIGIGNDCIFKYYTHLEARVGNAEIIADDVNFGDKTLNSISEQVVQIHNKGNADLKIFAYKLPTNFAINVNFNREITNDNPLIIKPNQKFSYTVLFQPNQSIDYRDSIVFFSNAKISDSVCYIFGSGINAGLTATSYNWNKKYAKYGNYTTKTYPIENEEKAIVIENTGSEPIKILSVEDVSFVNKDAFEFDREQFNNLIIEPNNKYKFGVNFTPLNAGDMNLSFKYVNDKNLEIITNLQGIGSVPSLNDIFVNFEEVPILTENIKKKVVLRNPNETEWQLTDTLIIEDFLHNADISDNLNKFGTQKFKYDKSELKFPLKIAPGDSAEFDVYFYPNKLDNFTANIDLKCLSNLHDANIFLKGKGINDAVAISEVNNFTCIHQEAEISVIIDNKGKNPYKVNKLEITTYEKGAKMKDSTLLNGFIVPSESQQFITLICKPETSNQIISHIKIFDSTDVVKKATLICNLISTQSYLISSPANQIVELGKKAKLNYNSVNSVNVNIHYMNQINYEIIYNPAVLLPDLNSITLSNDITGKFLITEKRIEEPGKIKLVLSSIADQTFDEKDSLFSIEFDTFFANDTINYSDMLINAGSENTCVNFIQSVARVETVPVCVDELRRIRIGESNFQITKIYPNPTSNNIISLYYSIGYDAFTEISIFNSLGELIYEIENTILKSGTYSKNLNISNLSSGLYFIKMKSGHKTITEKFIVE